MKIELEKDRTTVTVMQQNAAKKKRLFSEAKALCEEFIPIDTKERLQSFERGFKSHLLKELRPKVKDFATHWTDEKILEFFDIPVHILNHIQSQYNQLTQFQWNDEFTDLILPDLSTYAETPEELERLKLSQTLIETAKAIQKHGYPVNFNTLAQAVSMAIHPMGGKDAKPNNRFIKQRNR